MNKILAIFIVFFSSCHFKADDKNTINHTSVEDSINSCYDLKVFKPTPNGKIDTIVSLIKPISNDSTKFVTCGDQLLKNVGLLKTIWGLPPIDSRKSYMKNGNFLVLNTIRKTDKTIDIELFVVLKSNEALIKDSEIRYLIDSKEFMINTNPILSNNFITLKEWGKQDSLKNTYHE